MRRNAILLSIFMIMILIFSSGCMDSGHKEESVEDQITIRLFSNLPNRNNGQGLVEQMIINEYMEENPGVVIEVEALEEEAYKTKFKAYTMDGMPDIVSIWGQPSFLSEVLDAGVLAALDESDYEDYGFIAGSLEGFKKDGVLYGLPRNTDVPAFFYNEKMFQDHGWEVPETYEELILLAKDIRAANLIPIAMDGGDGWPLAVYYSDLLFKLTAEDYSGIVNRAIKTGNFSNPQMVKAAELLQEAVSADLFQAGYYVQDYGAAMNLFTTGRAAMFYVGSWEASMALNEDIAEEIRTNIRMFTMPVVEDGKATKTDIAMWNGGGYAVSADSEVKEEAIKFLNYMYQPDKLSKYGWENGLGLSAQDQTVYMNGNETPLQMQFVQVVNTAKTISGTPLNDCGPSAFKTSIESTIQSVSNRAMSTDEFLNLIGEACK